MRGHKLYIWLRLFKLHSKLHEIDPRINTKLVNELEILEMDLIVFGRLINSKYGIFNCIKKDL